MTAEGLRIVMEKGRVNRREYDRGRTKNLAYNEFMGLAELFQHVSLEIGLTDEQIKRLIGESGFERALSKGVLYKRGLRYSIPIPSLRDYMVQEWLVEKEHAAQEQSRSKLLPDVDPEKKDSKRNRKTIQQTVPRPKKRRGKNPRHPSRGKAILAGSPQGRDPFDSDRDTDMGMER